VKAVLDRKPLSERRYAVRYDFFAPAEALDLDSGLRSSGRTTDLSSSGCFVATSQPLPPRSRINLCITHGKAIIEILATVRRVKPATGMGLEFLDIEPKHLAILQSWLAPLRA
jgi:hypothetical protein